MTAHVFMLGEDFLDGPPWKFIPCCTCSWESDERTSTEADARSVWAAAHRDDVPPLPDDTCGACGGDGSGLDPIDTDQSTWRCICGVYHIDFCPSCGDEYTEPCHDHADSEVKD